MPPGGDVIRGCRVPEGTHIDFSAWGTQINGVFGENLEEFRPDKWLTSDRDQLEMMHQTHELIFCCGPTDCLGMPMAMTEMNDVIFKVSFERWFFA